MTASAADTTVFAASAFGIAPSNPCANSTLTAAGTTAQQQIATAQGFIAAGQVGASATPYANPVLLVYRIALGVILVQQNIAGPGHFGRILQD